MGGSHVWVELGQELFWGGRLGVVVHGVSINVIHTKLQGTVLLKSGSEEGSDIIKNNDKRRDGENTALTGHKYGGSGEYKRKRRKRGMK